MRIACVTLLPEMFDTLYQDGVVGRALEDGRVQFETINPRAFTEDVHRTVDDRPYGGGPGMVLKAEPLIEAIGRAKEQMPDNTPVVLLSPQGAMFDQDRAQKMALSEGVIFVAGRYEGIDERVVDLLIDEELSIGDFVLSGGEMAAMVVIDSVVRLLPEVLGNQQSVEQDSFSDEILDHPHYTRPETVAGLAVPEVLTSGDHARIERWRLKQALGRTWLRRPDLLEKRTLSNEEQALLDEYIKEQST